MQTDRNFLNKISKLKISRRIISMVFFVLTSLSILFVLPQQVANHILSFQLGPLILRLTAGLVGWSVASFCILVLAFVGFGRIYCSTICPLGFIQDVAIWFGKLIRIKHNWLINRKKQVKIFRVSLLAFTIVLFLAGNAVAIGLLEPFAVFSRLLFLLKMFFQSKVLGTVSTILLITVPAILILFLAAKKGRFFCSWLCPVGTMLWGFSIISLFKFHIKQTACNQCNKCNLECKAGAISVKEKKIDQALCIGCFNCVLVCKTDAIKIAPEIFKSKIEANLPEIRTERRKFLKQFGSLALVLVTPVSVFAGIQLKNFRSEKDHLFPVFPLGSTNLTRFKNNCTGCMLCASKCPAKIISPSMGSKNGSPIVPVLNFQNNYCLEDCVTCSQVCPTGALHEVLAENKKDIKMANLELKLKECRIVAEGLECAICAEICPLRAIEMKQVPDQKYQIPVVIQEKCNGCGKCQFRCPVKKKEEIFKFNS